MSDGKIIYDVEINDDGIESKVQNTNSKVTQSANTGSNAFGEVWTGALRRVGAGLVELGGKAISTAKDVAMASLDQVASLEQNLGGVQKLFGDNAQTVIDNANHAFRTAGLSANNYMETVTGFSASLISSLNGDTSKAASIADRAIRDMSDNANTFGTDIASIQTAYQGFAKQNYTMLDNLKLGYGGTKEEMAKLIADTAQMTAEQEKLGVTIDAESMSFDNIINAISVMQEHLSIAGTTSKEASGTIEGSINSLKAAWDNFLAGTLDGESLAEIAYDAMNNVFNAAMDIVPRLIQGLGAFLPLVVDHGLQLCGELIATIKAQIPTFLEQGRELIENIGQGLVQGIPNFLSKALPMVQEFTANLRQNAGKFIDSGINFITNLVQGIANSIPTLIQYFPTIISNVANIINDNMPKILAAGVNLIWILLKGIVQAIPTLIAEFPKIIQMIVDVWRAMDWLGIGKFLINAIGNGIRALLTSIPSLLKDIATNGFNAFRNISWGNLGNAIINGIVNGLRNGATAVLDAARRVAQSALDAAKDFLGIHSPSRVFRDEVGEQIDRGEAEGIIDNSNLVEDAAAEVSEKALDASMNVNYDLPNTQSVAQDIGASFTSRVAQTVNRVIEVPLNISGREIARATAWDMGEQLAWESR